MYVLFFTSIFKNLYGFTAYFLFCIYILNLLYKTYNKFIPQKIQAVLKAMLLGIIPLDAIMLLSMDYWLAAVVLLSLLIPGRLLAKHIYIT